MPVNPNAFFRQRFINLSLAKLEAYLSLLGSNILIEYVSPFLDFIHNSEKIFTKLTQVYSITLKIHFS